MGNEEKKNITIADVAEALDQAQSDLQNELGQ